MSNCIERSKELTQRNSEEDTENTRNINLNSIDSNLGLIASSDYTYHRHSAPKNVIYYRCSDKRCPVRVHFNLDSKTFFVKNRHLNAKVHKKPSSQKAVTSDELIALSNSMMRGPLILSNLHVPSSMSHSEEITIPSKRANSEIQSDSNDEKSFLLQIKVRNPGNLLKFSKELNERCLATKVSGFSGGKKYTNLLSEDFPESVIEVYTTSHFMSKVLLHINNFYGRGAEVVIFQQE